MSAINPSVRLLRPVSPLAWFQIGLVVFNADIDIPRPRVKADLPTHPVYIMVHKRLIALLEHELVTAEAA